jgi:Sulfotransferase family
MIVSRGRRYVFVHIPKTGGTALTLALEARAMAGDLIIADTPKGRARSRRLRGAAAAGRLWKHATLADIDGLITAEEREGFLTFTLIRNPWDRMASLYHWLRVQRFAHPLAALARSADFSGFLNAPATRRALLAAPYGSYLRRPDGTEKPSLFIRIEHFAEDAAPLVAHLGFRPGPLPRVNASDRPRDWRGLYSDADAALIAGLCAEDIARFGYRFDP